MTRWLLSLLGDGATWALCGLGAAMLGVGVWVR